MTIHTLDLRTLADEWQEATDLLEGPAEGQDPDDIEEARETDQKFRALCDQLGISPNNEPATLRWYANERNPLLIADYSFEEYAEELAVDIGAINREAEWPLSYIDWERAADALLIDYTTVEYDGTTYYTRST